jgi:hypothetical protein
MGRAGLSASEEAQPTFADEGKGRSMGRRPLLSPALNAGLVLLEARLVGSWAVGGDKRVEFSLGGKRREERERGRW